MHQPDQNPSPISSVEEMSILDYLEIIAKKWWFITKVTIAAAILSIIISLSLTKIYSSTTRFIPPQPDMNLMGMMMGGSAGGLSSLAGGVLGMGTPADQYASILESERISDSIINRFHLMEVYNKDYRLDMYKKLEKFVEVTAGKKDGIITITVEDEDPKRAAEIANAYVDELGKLTVEMNMTGGIQNKLFLEKRLAQSRTDLNKSEEEIKKFQTKNKTIDVTEQAKASITGIAELRAQLALQEIQLAGLSRRFTESSQEVKDTKTAISRIKSQIAQLEGSGKGGAIPTVGSMPDMGQEFVRLMRDFKTQEMIVELLTKQHELAKLTEAKDINNIQIIQKATVPDKKVKPKRARIVILTTIFAFAFSMGSIIVRHHFDTMPSETKLRLKDIVSSISPWLASRL